jgi:hypothetical protein
MHKPDFEEAPGGGFANVLVDNGYDVSGGKCVEVELGLDGKAERVVSHSAEMHECRNAPMHECIWAIPHWCILAFVHFCIGLLR